MYILAFEEIFDSASDNVLIFDLEHTSIFWSTSMLNLPFMV